MLGTPYIARTVAGITTSQDFPGALFDVNGYVVFLTEQSYRNCRHLALGDHIHLTQPGISAIPGYIRVKSAGA
jgi:hypothetical protein